MLIDKYNLTKKENIFLFKKHFSSIVYTGLKMENRNITFPQTETILYGVNDGNVQLDDIYAILGMKRAIEVFLKNVDSPLTLDLLKEFNYHIAKEEAIESGIIRPSTVSISGTSYTPSLVSESDVVSCLNSILLAKTTNTEKAIDLFIQFIFNQFFWDGNKRTALLGANFILCQNGCGLLEICDKNISEFATLLNDMFNSGKSEKLKTFLYHNCIEGMTV